MNPEPILLLTEGDPWGAPTGGQTTFAKHLLTALGARFAVTSHCDDETIPVGEWIQRPYAGTPVWFFNRGSIKRRKDKKPLVPARIQAYFKARQFLPCIRKKEFSGLLTDSPEMLFAVSPYKWKSVCYRFAGLNNPMVNSRYPWARILGGYFEERHIACVNRIKPDVMIAAADHAAIEEFHDRTGNVLDRSRFHQFSTRVDTDLFYPIERQDARRNLGLPLDSKIFVTTGRLCWIKGWDLLLEAFVSIKQEFPDAILIFVGDGEDHANVEALAKALGIQENVRIAGFVPQSDVVRYMNAADVCLVGSHREGWSLAMCEMLACGKAIVSTDVSGARDMVHSGKNGYVVEGRDPHNYAAAMLNAMELNNFESYSLHLAEMYAVRYLARDLVALWEPLRDSKTSEDSNCT